MLYMHVVLTICIVQLTVQLTLHFSIVSHRYRLDIWQRDVPWSSVKQLRTVLETEYGIDHIFDGQLASTTPSTTSKKLGKDAQAKSEKANRAYGLTSMLYPFSVAEQNTGICLHFREVPLPW